jgi:hypothetical protein
MLKFFNLSMAVASVVLVTPAFAVGLTESDFSYLSTRTVQRSDRLIQSLSPKEQSRLHALINDAKTANDPAARAKDVSDVLAEFKSHQDWELDHPGQLWDVPNRRIGR